MQKKPWLAALLNVVLTGLGYIYIGKRIIFGLLLMTGEILGCVWYFMDTQRFSLSLDPWLKVILVLHTIAFAVDGYKTAKEI